VRRFEIGDANASKKERKAFDSTLKVLVQGFFRDSIMPGIGTAIGAGVGAVLFLDYLSLRK
jgi:hypothetical protein